MDIWFNRNPELRPYLERGVELRSSMFVSLLAAAYGGLSKVALALRHKGTHGRLRPTA